MNRVAKIFSAGGIPMGTEMPISMTMIYWKENKLWMGKILEYPEIMSKGETLEKLEENLKDAYLHMVEWVMCLKNTG
jgi:hypothetical protein